MHVHTHTHTRTHTHTHTHTHTFQPLHTFAETVLSISNCTFQPVHPGGGDQSISNWWNYQWAELYNLSTSTMHPAP